MMPGLFGKITTGALLAALAPLLSACGDGRRPLADRFSESGELIALSGGKAGAVNACISCHGLDGGGNGAGAPRIAGTDPGYLSRQLDDYATGRRRNTQMEYIARQLSPADRQAVAFYYAALPLAVADAGADAKGAAVASSGQTLTAAAAGAPLAPPALWVHGDPERGLQPCAACHGQGAEGRGTGVPMLAGQPAQYVAYQLQAWKEGHRRNDPGNLMQRIARRMTTEEISLTAAYAASLSPARPESPAASLSARRDGSRSDASGQQPRAAE